MKSISLFVAVARPISAVLSLLVLTSPAAGGQMVPEALPDSSTNMVQVQRAPGAQLQIITLDPPTGADMQAHLFDGKGNRLHDTPATFRRLGEATLGEQANLHTLTLRFAAAATITEIGVTRDFQIEPGGSCAKGNAYQSGSTCTLLLRFTPRGPGNRLGQLTITHSASAIPESIGLGGYGYAPVLSFNPSIIQTVLGTYPSNVGLLNGALNMATDGGDRLFISDTGNARILMIDSSGTIYNYSFNYTTPSPLGLTVDSLGRLWFTSTADTLMRELSNPYSGIREWGGINLDNCGYGTTPCNLGDEHLNQPGELSVDMSGNIFFSERYYGGALSNVLASNPSLLRLHSLYAWGSGRFASDPNDNLYGFDNENYACEIFAQTLNGAYDYPGVFQPAAGGFPCGYSGDGGDARNAEISSSLGQFAFDAAGDLYFTDSGNQRVRRIDYTTGIIHTIAGIGTLGYTGDGGSAKAAKLSKPTGLAVDSQGQVYIISGDGGAGTNQVIRKVTSQGVLAFGNQARITPSAANTMRVTNTGNSTMVLTHLSITGTNPGDFTIDPITTSCGQAKGDTLDSGATCTIGVVFNPAATGARSAKIVFADNTVTSANTVLLNGTGILATPSLKVTAPTAGQSFKSGTAIPVTASVTSASGPAPTGQVQFSHDGVNYGSPVTLSSGTGSISMTGLTIAAHSLGAKYLGDANYAPAGPISVSITVTAVKLGSFVTLSQTLNAAGTCAAPQFAVNVSSKSGPVPAGEVQLLDGGILIASGMLAAGEVVLTPHPPSPGTHTLTASYEGDANYLPAVSTTLVMVAAPTRPCTGPVKGGISDTPTTAR